MVIDTKDVSNWVKTHLLIVVPVVCAALAWFAAMRWQAALDHNQTALMIFYFCVSAASGLTSLALTIAHLNRLGLFE